MTSRIYCYCFVLFVCLFSEKRGLDVSCESSARLIIHLNGQTFSRKKKKKNKNKNENVIYTIKHHVFSGKCTNYFMYMYNQVCSSQKDSS